MSSFKHSHFFSKKFQHICVSLDVNFNESLTNDVVSFEQLGPEGRILVIQKRNGINLFPNFFLRRRDVLIYRNDACFITMEFTSAA